MRDIKISIKYYLYIKFINMRIVFSFGLALLFFSISIPAKSQKVFSCNNRYDADIKVFVVENRYDADLLVFKVSNEYDADGNKGLWYFCKNRYDAKKKIWFAENKYDADLLICFVKNKYDAGWREKEKMHLLY